MLGGGTALVNVYDQIVQSGNYCNSSMRVASNDQKNNFQKIIVTLIQTIFPNHITLHVDEWGVCYDEVRTLAPVFKKISFRAQSKLNLDANTEMHQCKPTSKDLHTSDLYGHWMQSRGLARNDVE